MSYYAVGDLQGCLNPLKRLLDTVQFDPAKDTLWLAGDLVNRGPQSLDTLRFIYHLGDAAQAVLGNHDLHLLAVHAGITKEKRGDTLSALLQAPDCEALIHWLRHQPLIRVEKELNYAICHAGIPPIWNLHEAQNYAKEVEHTLQSADYQNYLQAMYGNSPAVWHVELAGTDRLRVITNYFTRMRFCDAEGVLELKTKTGPALAPSGYAPWFSFSSHRLKLENPDTTVLFGHWAALMGKTNSSQFIGLDTGCVWGEKLTMLRLDDGQFFSTPCD